MKHTSVVSAEAAKKSNHNDDIFFDLIVKNKKLENFLEKLNKDGAVLGIGDDCLEKLIETFSYRNRKIAH